jgi:hypothetical protein
MKVEKNTYCTSELQVMERDTPYTVAAGVLLDI